MKTLFEEWMNEIVTDFSKTQTNGKLLNYEKKNTSVNEFVSRMNFTHQRNTWQLDGAKMLLFILPKILSWLITARFIKKTKHISTYNQLILIRVFDAFWLNYLK